MNDAISVSSTTYQRRLLDRGLVAGSREEAQIRFAAPKGAFLGHVLYANGVPIAFQYGLLYNGTYFCEHTGYDPCWSACQPGAVLFIQALLDFEKRKADLKVMDFGQGLNLFKERTANERHAITHYYLFNRTASGFLHYRTAQAMTRTVKLLSIILHRLKLRETVRVFTRRWTGRGHMK
jgi:CelD/BcsL family acetyltransferase involved in cellulose biosynthesis